MKLSFTKGNAEKLKINTEDIWLSLCLVKPLSNNKKQPFADIFQNILQYLQEKNCVESVEAVKFIKVSEYP